MEFFSQTYVALRGPTGAPQTPEDTIVKLSDRLSPATLLADRRAAVLSLKGLSRNCKEAVGERALPGLLEVLANDAELDHDIAKAVLETLNILCSTASADSTPASKELGFKHTDQVLADEKAAHTVFALLADPNVYVRFNALQFLSTLLSNRRQAVQGHFLTMQGGATAVITVLEATREMIRDEAISIVQLLISQSPNIQKILAFEGAFEKLFNAITHEGGVEGGIVVQDALKCVDGLLRYNASNQSYFRETSLPATICSLLLFPMDIQLDSPPPQEFSLQFWDSQKLANATLVVGIMGMLLGSGGGGSKETLAFTRCFIEMGLASNVPTALKAMALRLLPQRVELPLSELVVTPYAPVPETNGEEWDRLEPVSALDALVDLVLHGEYNGLDSAKRSKDSLSLRTAAISVFENFVRREEIKIAILQGMLPSADSSPPPSTPLLQALVAPPSSSLEPGAVTSTQLSAFLFCHLLRSSSHAKSLALTITPATLSLDKNAGNFFVPADGAPPPQEPEPEDKEPPQSLLQILTEHLSLSLLSRSRADTSERDLREWDRLVVAYLCLLSQWLWDEPKVVRGFLDAGGLGMLVEQINQSSEVDGIVPGLCAFLLGVCYEFNREPGEITRSIIHPILNRLGVDTLSGRMSRVREDERFSEIGPDSVVLTYPTPSHSYPGSKREWEDEAEVWFDWAFIEFWKSNLCGTLQRLICLLLHLLMKGWNTDTVQRAIATDPDASSISGPNAEAMAAMMSLKEVIRKQAQEIDVLQNRLSEYSSQREEIQTLKRQVDSLVEQLKTSEGRRKEVEKEQEDLLVLLDEVSGKRKRDKERLRAAGLEFSDEEGDDEENHTD